MQRVLGTAIFFALGLGFGLVLGGWRSVSMEPVKPPAQTFTVPSTPANLADPTYVGVRAGDHLISVNGIKDATMFHALDAGIKRGNVCVTFERHSKVQQVCLGKPSPDTAPERAMTGERPMRDMPRKDPDEEDEPSLAPN
jgi:hypothetical protein